MPLGWKSPSGMLSSNVTLLATPVPTFDTTISKLTFSPNSIVPGALTSTLSSGCVDLILHEAVTGMMRVATLPISPSLMGTTVYSNTFSD